MVTDMTCLPSRASYTHQDVCMHWGDADHGYTPQIDLMWGLSCCKLLCTYNRLIAYQSFSFQGIQHDILFQRQYHPISMTVFHPCESNSKSWGSKCICTLQHTIDVPRHWWRQGEVHSWGLPSFEHWQQLPASSSVLFEPFEQPTGVSSWDISLRI